MGYTDYEFYKNDYYGDSIPESSFNKYSDKAEIYLHKFTYHRLVSKLPTYRAVSKQIKKCICELSEQIYGYEQYVNSMTVNEEGKTQQIKSASAGSESVTYAGNESIYANMTKTPELFEKYLYGITVKYLDGLVDDKGVCLLYGGL